MTSRWEKGDSHVVLVVEGLQTNVQDFQQALNINLEANLIIDCSALDTIDSKSIDFLNTFSKNHKQQHFSIILVFPSPLKGLRNIERINTLPEARDMIFMEIAERELGFFDLDEE